ncbi:putative ribonuclease H-like domain-containing protein [Tanacetum coccineum]|uniref:Ribonuclease H-like domain-containing protein n=1 Tax=Tanacetum coccineum TaxID=301880 RepID=A0ABQ5FPW2_9ASTR
MCDKKNSVLFTEIEGLVLSPDFKLLDESQVLLRVPKQSNMYIFDLKNVVPSRDLTWNQTDKNASPQETNRDTGLKKNVDVGQTGEENARDDTTDDATGKKTIQKPASENEQALKNVLDKMMDQEKEATEQLDAVRKEFEAQFNAANTFRGVNTASASGTFSDVGPSFVPLGGSFPIDFTNLPHDPLMPYLEDTTEKAIGTKLVFRNKKDGRGIVVRNKASLVAQGHKQEEGIDYDEVFAPVARIKTIRLFLAFASFMNFLVYQMDVKSAFFYGTIVEEVYVNGVIFGSTKKSLCQEFEVMMHKRFQMSYMGEITFFLGLQVKQQAYGIFINQDKYVADILNKFDFAIVKTASTPLKPNKPLLKDEEAILERSTKLGFWYPRDSPLELEAFNDSDYAGASLDRKSTTGAEYVVAANFCGQILWIQN